MKTTVGSLKARKARFALAAMCALLATQAVAKRPSRKGVSPAEVVRQYCKLDSEGARLSSQNPYLDNIFSLATWQDEPGWDSATVTRGFAITQARAGRATSAVTVRYEVLGNMSGTSVVASRQHIQLVTFVLRKSTAGWKIDRPLIRPHVSIQAASAALMSLLKGEKDPRQRKHLRDALAVLRRWKGRSGTSGGSPGPHLPSAH